ncbi:peptidase M52 [Actinoplanes lobatus]|uniref:Hydrogenase maturation protease n=1 Tax=Actinoplanes lobatus TaxID=113568 RepID=A0A7W7HNN4_9ACTN|nr:hydrogenase maturation protease [Actinoplanes lobatus]MBB4753577.1 hydrogenase maturation protease [Actinoplanes lobatus]GGN84721.1 peptidase M52 [Actinoplanes lobatus]GIE38114.1 peptidase M52 [Actinoplanes lobatus]
MVIGVGNEYRRDDGFGPTVVARLTELGLGDPESGVTVRATDGEPTRLIDLWTGADLAVVVDAVRDGHDHGGHRYELVLGELTDLPDERSSSSHGISLGSTVELGQALGRLPHRLVVLAVGGHEFGFGAGLTPEVAAAVEPVVARVRDLVG